MVPLCDGLFYGKKTHKLQMTIEQRQVKGQEFFVEFLGLIKLFYLGDFLC